MTFLQAGLSALLSLPLGFLSCRGLLAFFGKRHYPFLEGLCLLPALSPPLLTALSLVHLTEAFFAFPFGFPALVFANIISCVGLCAVAFARALAGHIGPLSEWALLYTSSPWVFLAGLLKGPLLKDVKILFVLVFVSCWTGLSLPLLLSGSSDFSLEFFIYEQMKDPETRAQAPALVLLQSLFVFGLCFWSFAGRPLPGPPSSFQKIRLLPQAFYILVPVSALFLSLAGLAFVSDMGAFSRFRPFLPLIVSAGRNSLLTGLGVGLLTLGALSLMSLSHQSRGPRRFVASFTPPGASFMGLSLLLLPFLQRRRRFVEMDIRLELALVSLGLPLERGKGFRAFERAGGNRGFYGGRPGFDFPRADMAAMPEPVFALRRAFRLLGLWGFCLQFDDRRLVVESVSLGL